MTEYDEIITAMDIVSTKVTIATNVTSTASINCHSIKVRDCYISQAILLEIILLLIIIIVICYHYVKQKGIIWKWKIMKLKKFVLKIVRIIISMISW